MQAYFYKETIVHFLRVNKSYIFFNKKLIKFILLWVFHFLRYKRNYEKKN